MKFLKLSGTQQKKVKVYHQSAGGVLIYPQNHILKVALLQKKDGKWVIPKGHIKKDETSKEAAIREIKEELSISINEELKNIGKIGVNTYSFIKNSRLYYKKVHLFVFLSSKELKLRPLAKEDFSQARWFDFDDALNKVVFDSDRKNLAKAKELYYSMIDRKLKKHAKINEILHLIKDKLGKNLFAIISTGSTSFGVYRNGWSDVDLLIVVKDLDFKIKNIIAGLKNKLSKKYRVDFGINVILERELKNPLLPEITLDGKTLQALLYLKRFPERLLYGKKRDYYSPSKEEIIKYSLSNIAMFLLRNRKMFTEKQVKTLQEIKKLTRKMIRAAFITTKLSIQYFTLQDCRDYSEVIYKAERLFKDFNFRVLKKNLQIINKWPEINSKKILNTVLNQTDNFIESFNYYVFGKVNKK